MYGAFEDAGLGSTEGGQIGGIILFGAFIVYHVVLYINHFFKFMDEDLLSSCMVSAFLFSIVFGIAGAVIDAYFLPPELSVARFFALLLGTGYGVFRAVKG